ncbi:MAG TPA: hypothetical protein VNY24_00580 [Candidatus Acidoferrales bacterium]|nr:hypothetical protein [Candidatus Acidoferrales bacterium]
MLRDRRAGQPAFARPHRLQILEPGFHEAPRVLQPQSYCSRFRAGEFLREFVLLCFQIGELRAKGNRQTHAGDRFRAVADPAFDQFEAAARRGRFTGLPSQELLELFLEPLERVFDDVGMQDLGLEACEQFPL